MGLCCRHYGHMAHSQHFAGIAFFIYFISYIHIYGNYLYLDRAIIFQVKNHRKNRKGNYRGGFYCLGYS